MAVHGFGARPGMFSLIFGPYVSTLKFALVQPVGSGMKLSFNGLHCCGDAVDKNIDDIQFLKSIIHQLNTWLPINLEYGVAGTGFSNGGFLIERAVLSGSNIFSAIAPVGGHSYMYNSQNRGLFNVTKPIPIYLQHAIRDPVVKFEGCCATSRCCCGISERSPSECISVNSIFDNWLSLNRCSGRSSSIEWSPLDKSTTISSSCYSGNDCQVNTKLCIHQNVLHAYPGRAKGHFPVGSGQLSILFFLLQSICEYANHGSWSATLPNNNEEVLSIDPHFNHIVLNSPVSCRCKRGKSDNLYCMK
jgi:poly(3-hydroxybutyrate) depolymerase